jgi:hypothetical protein
MAKISKKILFFLNFILFFSTFLLFNLNFFNLSNSKIKTKNEPQLRNDLNDEFKLPSIGNGDFKKQILSILKVF